jgi:hypothetical protein
MLASALMLHRVHNCAIFTAHQSPCSRLSLASMIPSLKECVRTHCLHL